MRTKKILVCLVIFWVNGPCFIQNLPIFLNLYGFVSSKISKIIWKVSIFNNIICICTNINFYAIWKSILFIIPIKYNRQLASLIVLLDLFHPSLASCCRKILVRSAWLCTVITGQCHASWTGPNDHRCTMQHKREKEL